MVYSRVIVSSDASLLRLRHILHSDGFVQDINWYKTETIHPLNVVWWLGDDEEEVELVIMK